MRTNWAKKGIVFGIIIVMIGAGAVSGFSGNLFTNAQPIFDIYLGLETLSSGNVFISNPYPVNGSTNIPVQPTCNITLNHSNGTGMTLSWYENSTGPWVLRQTNGSTHWYDAAWKYRKLITIDHTHIPSTLTNFPILVSLATDSDLAADAQNDGDDLCFIAYSDNSTKLNHEIEWFNGSTGKLSAWVNIPSISSITNTKIWMYYGNSLTGTQENVAGVWDANFGGVWHMQEINAIDSTDNGNTGSQTGSPFIASGVVNNSVDFIPTDSINVGAGDSINTANDDTLTWECWINGDSNAVDQVFLEQSQASNSWNVVLGTYDTDVPTNEIKWITRDDDGTNRDTISSGVSITTGSWMHIAGTYNNGASDNKSLYINGVLKAYTTTGINNLRDGPTTATHIGYGGDYAPYDGKIDEVRMSSNVRNASWINATYQTIAHPSTFFSMDAEQSLLHNGTYRWIFTQASANTTTYFWKVAVTDTYQNKTAIYHFTTAPEPNQPPYPPSNPTPTSGSTGVSIYTDLSWTCSDPDGDPLTYNVYFGVSSSPPLVANNISATTYDPGTLAYNTLYYWKIIAWDTHGASTIGPLWHFTTSLQPNQPPFVPSSPSPTNGSTDVSINADLSWQGGDPDPGDTVTYDVYFGTSNPPPHMVYNQSGQSYNPGSMAYNTLYYWRIVAWDNHGASATGPLWHFTTGVQPNNPPYTPNTPSPVNASTGVSVNADLNWLGGDPDPGDTVTYDVYFGTTSSPPIVSHNQSSLSYDPGTLNYYTSYYWKIVAWDNHGTSTTGPLWHFTTASIPNRPPYAPQNPNPANGSTDISINTDLSWTGGDPDSGDFVTYDIYFGTTFPLIKIVSNTSGTSHTLHNLSYSTKYYWKIIAWDNHQNTNTSTLWSFTTKTDTTLPSIQLTSPSKGYLSINIGNIIIGKIPIFITTIIIGKTDVTATVTDSQSGVSRVEFYLDDILKASFNTGPYTWAWTESGYLFPYTLKVLAYDNAGNQNAYELKLWKIF